MSEQYFQFDKFVRDLEERERLQKERRERLNNEEEAWPTRELNRRYRERTHERIVVRGDDEHKS